MLLCHLDKTYLLNMVDYLILETGQDVLKTMIKKVVCKTAKATGELKTNKIAKKL